MKWKEILDTLIIGLDACRSFLFLVPQIKIIIFSKRPLAIISIGDLLFKIIVKTENASILIYFITVVQL